MTISKAAIDEREKYLTIGVFAADKGVKSHDE